MGYKTAFQSHIQWYNGAHLPESALGDTVHHIFQSELPLIFIAIELSTPNKILFLCPMNISAHKPLHYLCQKVSKEHKPFICTDKMLLVHSLT